LHLQIPENIYITTCRGWGHILSATLQAAQLVQW